MTVPLLVKQLTDQTPDYYDEDGGVNSLPERANYKVFMRIPN